MPILQDAASGSTWAGLGGVNDSLLVVDRGGEVVGRILDPVYPGVIAELDVLIEPLLLP